MELAMSERIRRIDWGDAAQSLLDVGHARVPSFLNSRECDDLVRLYSEDIFRATIKMERHRFGVGEYKYMAAPLPQIVQELRASLYTPLADIANEWIGLLGSDERSYPDSHESFLTACHQQGQERPTPLLLRYQEGGYNCLHQDLYGEVAFPFQVVFLLNDEFTGGEFLLVEQRPRSQSRGHAIALNRGDGLIFPTNHRPMAGTRGYYRAKMRHGVSTVSSGTRYTLGVIFHDAM